MTNEEIKKKIAPITGIPEIDEVVAESLEETNNREELVKDFLVLANPELKKFFERERDRFLNRNHDPRLDPRGLAAVRDTAVLEYIQNTLNVINKLLK